MRFAVSVPRPVEAAAHQSGRAPTVTASAPRTYMSGLRLKAKRRAKRSCQPTVRSSAGIGSTPYSSTAGTDLRRGGFAAERDARGRPTVAAEEVDHDAVVLLGPVEDRRVVRAADDVLLRVSDPLEDRLLPAALPPPLPP